MTGILFIILALALGWYFTRGTLATVSNAFSGVGTIFKNGDGSSNEGFAAIAEINSIDGPNKTKSTIDVTSLDSTGGYREFISSFRDAGQVVLNMNFTRDRTSTVSICINPVG